MIQLSEKSEIKTSKFYSKGRKLPLLFTRKLKKTEHNLPMESQEHSLTEAKTEFVSQLTDSPSKRRENGISLDNQNLHKKSPQKAKLQTFTARDTAGNKSCKKRTKLDDHQCDTKFISTKKLKLDLSMDETTAFMKNMDDICSQVCSDAVDDLNLSNKPKDIIDICTASETSPDRNRENDRPKVSQRNLRSFFKRLDATHEPKNNENNNCNQERFKILDELSQSSTSGSSSPVLPDAQNSSSGLGSSPKSRTSSPSQEQSSIRRYFSSTTESSPKYASQPTPTISSKRAVNNNSKRSLKLGKGVDPSSPALTKKAQMYLDLGQKDFGHVTCPTCNMVYTRAQPEDEAEHLKFHQKFVTCLRFRGWKSECVLQHYDDGRVIVISPKDHVMHLKKAADVRSVVDDELGFSQENSQRMQDAQTYIFIANNKVIGCVVAVEVAQAYRMLAPMEEGSHQNPVKERGAWCCSSTPTHAQCGISRIWVLKQNRRQGIATRLLDCVRNHFIYGCVVDKEALAFSDPTPTGKLLAESYIGCKTFLVFR